MAPPFKQAEFSILYGEGTSLESEILEYGVDHGLIIKSGNWYSYNDERIGHGKEAARTWLKDNPDAKANIGQALRQKLLPQESAPAVTDKDVANEPTTATVDNALSFAGQGAGDLKYA